MIDPQAVIVSTRMHLVVFSDRHTQEQTQSLNGGPQALASFEDTWKY